MALLNDFLKPLILSLINNNNNKRRRIETKILKEKIETKSI